jgi:hypothetical protein
MRALFVSIVGVAALLLNGCSSDGGGVANDCAPNATRACSCSDGTDGSQVCSASGFWRACTCSACTVTPSCEGKACGADDGCGNACLVGSCAAGLSCVRGKCSDEICVPKCTGKMCGDPDECGGVCTSAPCAKTGFACVAGTCQCKPVCTTCGADDTCGGKCSTGACDAGFKCASGSCTVDPTSKWVITVTNGSIPIDRDWNSFSAPDAMVCLWIGGTRRCTADASDTLSPSWGCAFPPVTAATLMAGVDVETFDNDRSAVGTCAEAVSTAPGEAICSRGTVPVTAANFRSKTWSVSCTAMTVNATLTPL